MIACNPEFVKLGTLTSVDGSLISFKAGVPWNPPTVRTPSGMAIEFSLVWELKALSGMVVIWSPITTEVILPL